MNEGFLDGSVNEVLGVVLSTTWLVMVKYHLVSYGLRKVDSRKPVYF